MVVFSLMGWSPHIPSEFLVFRRTRCISYNHPFAYKSVTSFGAAFQPSSAKVLTLNDTREELLPLLRAPPLSLATTHGIVLTFFSSGYLDVSVPRVPSTTLCIHVAVRTPQYVGFPIRISTDLCSFAAPRSFSQLVTSFFGAMYQGILRMLFVA